MAHKSLELRYPMIQFLIMKYIRKLEKNPRKPDYENVLLDRSRDWNVTARSYY